MHLPKLMVATFAASLAACSTTYKPNAVNATTGLYSTMATVDAGGVVTGRTPVRFADYGAVLVVAESNKFPSRLEFVMRRALADMGFTNVLDVKEFRRLAEDKKFELPDQATFADVKRFSNTVTPVLLIDMRYVWAGGARHFGGMRVVDGRTGEALLTVDHPKTVWLNTDDEVIYPVLNELRKWQKRVGSQTT